MKTAAPSAWVERFAPLIAPAGAVLDLACGRGRHTRMLLASEHNVTAVDRDLSGIADLVSTDLERLETDLEGGAPWPFAGRRFAAVVVTNYLHRPLFPDLIASLAPDGVLIYETFAHGNERFGKPRNPDFLLKPGELLEIARDGALRVIGYEDVEISEPRQACVQRIAAQH
jgi:SAM-dependent methyltransferase